MHREELATGRGAGRQLLRRDTSTPVDITWQQEIGRSMIEAQKIAGHATVGMMGDYTIVQLKR
jgi:hypothetical protein